MSTFQVIQSPDEHRGYIASVTARASARLLPRRAGRHRILGDVASWVLSHFESCVSLVLEDGMACQGFACGIPAELSASGRDELLYAYLPADLRGQGHFQSLAKALFAGRPDGFLSAFPAPGGQHEPLLSFRTPKVHL